MNSQRRCAVCSFSNLIVISCCFLPIASGFLPVKFFHSGSSRRHLIDSRKSVIGGLFTASHLLAPKLALRRTFDHEASRRQHPLLQANAAKPRQQTCKLKSHSDSINPAIESSLEGSQRNAFLRGLTNLVNAPTLMPPSFHPVIDKLSQILLCSGLYAFHVFVLCHKTVTLRIPFVKGMAPMVTTWEIFSGTIMFVGFLILSGKEGRSWVQSALVGDSVVSGDSLPTKAVSDKDAAAEKRMLPQTLLLLGLAYLGSGYIGQFIEILLCVLAAVGVPITLGMCRSLQVLLSHLFWVAAGSQILQRSTGNFYARDGPWFRCDFGGNLFWAVTGGYWLTSYITSVALQLNALASGLPLFRPLAELLQRLPEAASEAVIDQLRANDGGDPAAQLLGCLGPCLTGPIWEELLYRGFLLRALALHVPLPLSIDASSLVFALNHMNARAFAHLYVLGYIWAVIYIKSKNLLVPMMIHMMWNGRTFISPV